MVILIIHLVIRQTRAINLLCVTAGKRTDRMNNVPDTNLCFRGGGFDERYRDFFTQGKKFRQPVRLLSCSTLFKNAELNGENTFP